MNWAPELEYLNKIQLLYHCVEELSGPVDTEVTYAFFRHLYLQLVSLNDTR